MIKYPIRTTFEPFPSSRKFIDRTGRRVNNLTVLGYVGVRGNAHTWVCRCICGTLTNTTGKALQRGRVKSCGCIREYTTHRQWNHPLYNTWNLMLQRCNNPSDTAYSRYGGRGIKVCERWRDIHNFIADMHPKPSQQHSIERSDNAGDYSPDNCHWALPVEQSNNRRSNRMLTLRGRTQNVTAWAVEAGMPPRNVFYRLSLGWTPEDAVFIPIQAKGQKVHKMRPREKEPIKSTSRLITFNGKTQTVTEWSRECHLNSGTLTNRLNSGWSIADALNQPLLSPKLRKQKAF